MKVVILDETKMRRVKLAEGLERNSHKVRAAAGSSDFIDGLQSEQPDILAIDIDSWRHGMALYRYIGLGRKMEPIPVVFYNTSDDFAAVPGRERNDRDRAIPGSPSVESIIEAIESN